MIRFAIITFICLVAVTLITQGIIQDYNRNKEFYETYHPYYYGNDNDWYVSPILPFHVFIIVILCTGLPMIEMSSFNSRKYLDSAFSFPISRISMLSVNLINGYLQFLLAYTISFIWYAIRLAPCADKLMDVKTFMETDSEFWDDLGILLHFTALFAFPLLL